MTRTEARRRGRRRREIVRRPLAQVGRHIAKKSLSASAFVAILLLLVSLATPITRVVPADAATDPSGTVDVQETQAMAVGDHSDESPSARDAYGVTTRAELLRQRYTLSYTTSWSGPIRWPFPQPVPIADGFGYRVAPCAGCSTYHTAIDLAPGGGVPIYSIAAGVVVEHQDGNGSWGNYVVIEHEINGQKVVSSYAHMQRGSSPLVPGQTIGVGEYIGLVGATGQVTGAHLHLVIEVDGVLVDPYLWLTENAG